MIRRLSCDDCFQQHTRSCDFNLGKRSTTNRVHIPLLSVAWFFFFGPTTSHTEVIVWCAAAATSKPSHQTDMHLLEATLK